MRARSRPRVTRQPALLRRRLSTVEVSEILTDVRGHLSFGPPKTRSSRRTVPVPDFLIDRLKAHLAMRGDLSGDALVFVMPDGSPLRDDNWRRRHWKPAVRRAGLPDNLRFHDLRVRHEALCHRAG
jgi:integrase